MTRDVVCRPTMSQQLSSKGSVTRTPPRCRRADMITLQAKLPEEV